MARDYWDEDDYRAARERRERGRHGRDDRDMGYDPYQDDSPRERYYRDREPGYMGGYDPYNSASLGVPGALGLGGRYYTGGGAFGSRGLEDPLPERRGRRDEREHRSDHNHRSFWDKTADEVQSWMGDEDAARRRRMDKHHRGRGPRGYKRSDDRINEDVHDRLTDDWMLDASDIEVSVADGEVTLNGTVESREDKRRAEDIVDDISGVTHVQNNLRVRPRGEENSRSMTTG